MTTTATETPVDAEAIRERGKDLELSTKRGLHTGTPAYTEYAPEMRKLIKESLLPKEATDADLYMLLELAATYRLDPFTRELWAVKMPGRNAAQGGYLTIMVGRDGMLAIAERHPDYRGYRCQAVHENDTFEYDADPRPMPDGTHSHVRHSFSVIGDRGKLLGAWAEVYREGRPPVFFFARIEEYVKTDEYSPWRKQTTVMIEKCALVTALRHAYRISGLYIADEMTNTMLAPAKEVDAVQKNDGWNWGDDDEVKFRLGDLFAALGERYAPAKQKLLLAGLDDDGRRDLIQRLEQECEAAGVPIPDPRGPDEERVTDDEIELVDESEPDATQPAPPKEAPEPEPEPPTEAGGQTTIA